MADIINIDDYRTTPKFILLATDGKRAGGCKLQGDFDEDWQDILYQICHILSADDGRVFDEGYGITFTEEMAKKIYDRLPRG